MCCVQEPIWNNDLKLAHQILPSIIFIGPAKDYHLANAKCLANTELLNNAKPFGNNNFSQH